MKRKMKILVAFTFLAITSVLVLNSCIGKDNLESRCEAKSEEVIDALTNWSTDYSVATCEDYKDAMGDYIDACSAYGLYNSAYEDQLDDIDCSVYAK